MSAKGPATGRYSFRALPLFTVGRQRTMKLRVIMIRRVDCDTTLLDEVLGSLTTAVQSTTLDHAAALQQSLDECL